MAAANPAGRPRPVRSGVSHDGAVGWVGLQEAERAGQ